MASTKNALRYALIVAGTLALAACGGGDDEAAGTNQEGYSYEPAPTAPTERQGDGVSQSDLGGQQGQPTQQGLALEAGDRVYFGYDQYNLSSAAQQTLRAQAAWLRKFPNVSVTVEGHCDERGTREYNLALGDRRANAVKDYLVSQGIAPSRVATISYGKERPIATCSAESCWSKNRRGMTVVNTF